MCRCSVLLRARKGPQRRSKGFALASPRESESDSAKWHFLPSPFPPHPAPGQDGRACQRECLTCGARGLRGSQGARDPRPSSLSRRPPHSRSFPPLAPLSPTAAEHPGAHHGHHLRDGIERLLHVDLVQARRLQAPRCPGGHVPSASRKMGEMGALVTGTGRRAAGGEGGRRPRPAFVDDRVPLRPRIAARARSTLAVAGGRVLTRPRTRHTTSKVDPPPLLTPSPSPLSLFLSANGAVGQRAQGHPVRLHRPPR
jgi:hypothetical protein